MTQSGQRVDAPILPRVAAGDVSATKECIARFGGLVWSIAKRLSIPNARIEDAVQDVFVEIWKNAGRYEASIASESTFVAMIARRRLIDLLRKLDRRVDSTGLSEGIEADAKAGGWRGGAQEVSMVQREEQSEDALLAARALDQLSPDQQRVLRLSIYRGLSHELISRVLDVPLGTVKTHARRGLIRLREILMETAVDGSGLGTRGSRRVVEQAAMGGDA